MIGLLNGIFKTVIFTVIFMSLSGCAYGNMLTITPVSQQAVEKSAWLVYWDLDEGDRDLKKIDGRLQQLSFFGAYFDQNNHLFIPAELQAKQQQLKDSQKRYRSYLTFVNDRQTIDGAVAMKDIDVLREVLANDVSMDHHVAAIVALTLENGYDGIEIDYERVWKDPSVGQAFLKFITKLYAISNEKQLALRVVLEPGTPFSTTEFVEGPEYVVMLYNLYGLHSLAGPKANKPFIEKVLTQAATLPGDKSAAIATGGCLWSDHGERRFLTEVEAKSLAIIYEAETKRDPASQCVVFEYVDNDVLYEVWYADGETLNYWIALIQKYNIANISLWRLGNNISLQYIN